MRFQGNFRKYGDIDVLKLRECVDLQSEETWGADEFRQKRFRVHSDTQSLYLLFDSDFRHFEPTRQQKYAEFSEALALLTATVSRNFGNQGWAVRCILTRLKAGGKIPAHADQGFSLGHAHRLHVPVVTNPGVRFTVGDETIHMRSGEIWEINNQRQHAVENLGESTRVHLILDWAEPMTHAQLEMYALDRRKHERQLKMGITPHYD